MASITKLPDGRWKVYVARKGVRKSSRFRTKQEAKDWAAREERLILDKEAVDGGRPLHEALARYAREVSINNKGHRWEVLRLEKLGRDKIGKILMRDLGASHIASWRDRRLEDVAPASVAREMGLLSSVLNVARKEWGWVKSNPVQDVRAPRKPRPRARVASESEMEALALSAGHDLTNATARAFHAFLFACETAMRAGEIVGLTWDRVFLGDRYLHLPETKNGHPRDVPLSSEAVRLIEALPRLEPVFGLRSDQLDALWRKLRDRAAVEDLRFHDSRRMGATKLAKKLDPMDLAKATGHRDLSMLLNTYYKTTGGDLARKLD